jgi:hypothetical protein
MRLEALRGLVAATTRAVSHTSAIPLQSPMIGASARARVWHARTAQKAVAEACERAMERPGQA